LEENCVLKKKEMTIHDLAKLAGVSVATISRSLNNSSLVQEDTKQRILTIADEMNFEINASARGLATSKMDTIGIILPSDYAKFGPQQYYASLMDDLRESLELSNYDLLVSFARNRITKKSNVIRLINRHKVDGLILLRETLDRDVLDFLEKKSVPYVFSHYPPAADDFAFDAVYTDHQWGGKLAGEHLASIGCKQILCMSIRSSAYEFVQRERGFYQALGSHGIAFGKENILNCSWAMEDGYRVVAANADKIKKADALFAVTDLLAFGAMQAIRDMGLRIPKDISVIGYDDIPLSASLRPKLTTIHQPREEIAKNSCKCLINKLQAVEDSQVKLKLAIRPYLVIRESCRKSESEVARLPQRPHPK
jgi:LacI family transcriptional regulator